VEHHTFCRHSRESADLYTHLRIGHPPSWGMPVTGASKAPAERTKASGPNGLPSRTGCGGRRPPSRRRFFSLDRPPNAFPSAILAGIANDDEDSFGTQASSRVGSPKTSPERAGGLHAWHLGRLAVRRARMDSPIATRVRSRLTDTPREGGLRPPKHARKRSLDRAGGLCPFRRGLPGPGRVAAPMPAEMCIQISAKAGMTAKGRCRASMRASATRPAQNGIGAP
jgi:hypothetical protein